MSRFAPFLTVMALAGACSPRDCEREAHGWCVEGAAPGAFVEEVAAAVEAVGIGWPGSVAVEPAPFPCFAGRCAGITVDAAHVVVAYDPSVGLGPGVGTTAIEHELCHAAGHWTEGGADAYASAALPDILRLLGPTATP